MLSLLLHDLWKVLLYSLLLGAGLPVVYAVGVRASGFGTAVVEGAEGAEVVAGSGDRRRQVIGKTVAVLCYVVVLAGCALGLAYIVAAGHGEQLSFQHGYPTFAPKS